MEGGTGGAGLSLLLSEAKALLERGAGAGEEAQRPHLFLAHPEAGYERVVPLALDAAKGLQVQQACPDEAAGGGVRWIEWPELKAVAEKRCVRACVRACMCAVDC